MTIKEFAQVIGVSPTTVSRAMHGRGRIGEPTRRMVMARMQELGFTPNVTAQRLSHGRTQMVMLNFGLVRDYLADMFLVEITRYMQEELDAAGYGALLSGPCDVVHRWVKPRAVDGVILVGDPPGSAGLRHIAEEGIACVVMGNHEPEAVRGTGSVVIGLAGGVQQVARLLVGQGHSDIAFIASIFSDAAVSAFRSELERLGASLPDSRIMTAQPTPHGGAEALTKLMQQSPPPTAVFARTDGLAIGALRAAHRMGIRVPDQLSIVGHDNVPFSELTEPPLTTVHVDCAKVARLAVHALVALLADPTLTLAPQVVDTKIVIRGSVSPYRPTSSSPARTDGCGQPGVGQRPGRR